MVIRKLEGRERFDAYLISAYCFHSRIEDVEKERERVEAETLQDWGAFDEDGTLTARIINNQFALYLDGTAVQAGGIGAVSTLPEYRDKGSIRKIFQSLLPEAYRSGEILSALYPFSHAFYRKQGYEVVTYQNDYELEPGMLKGYRCEESVTRWNPGEPVTEYLKIYQTFAARFNLAMQRDEKSMLEHMKVDRLYQERKFSYLLNREGQNVAYITFTDVYKEEAAILQVDECAWINREGFKAILSFLARFESDYGKIRLPLPAGIDLLRIIQTPRAYEIKKTCRQDFMVRVINAQKVLELICKPQDCDFVIQISDELIPENNGKWHVTGAGVTKADDGCEPDLAVSEQTFAQMAVGGANLDEAMLREDVEIRAKEEMLRNVFTEKRIFVGEHF